MDNLKINFADAVLAQTPVEKTTPGANAEQTQKEKFAKDFESILIGKLLDEMKNTIGEWGMEQDSSTKQMQGLFWMNLSQDLGSKGGLGMWKDIYQSLDDNDSQPTTTPLLDDTL